MLQNNKIIIVDDNEAIHTDFEKILTPDQSQQDGLRDLESSLFKGIESETRDITMSNKYVIDHAFTGLEAVDKIKLSLENGRPYAMAFVDQRMPPGIDGLETIYRLWELDPRIEIVICTAYSDYSWKQIINKLGITNQLIILKKPYEAIEAKQITLALVKKWNLSRESEKHKKNLEYRVDNQSHLIKSMFDFANKLHSVQDLDHTLSSIIIMIMKFINCKRISIMLLDEKEEYLYIKKAAGVPAEIVKNTKIKIGESIAGKVFSAGKPVVVNDLIKEGYSKNYTKYKSFISTPFICSPLMGNRVKLGVINVTNRVDDCPFTEEDINILTFISYTSAIALNNQLNEIKLETSFIETIQALADAIEAKDNYTGGHSARVAELSVGIGRELGLEKKRLESLNFAGILHDIGKIGIPESILCKRGRLTNEEFATIKQHPIIGENILKNINFYKNPREFIRHHHERLDGSGYPDGLKGDEISVEARILAVADCFDAMSSDRVYRKKMELPAIRKELYEITGRKLDKSCVDGLFRYLEMEEPSHRD